MKITLEIDRLVREHESANSVRVADFVRVVSRNELRGDTAAPQAPRFLEADKSHARGRGQASSDEERERIAREGLVRTPYATE